MQQEIYTSEELDFIIDGLMPSFPLGTMYSASIIKASYVRNPKTMTGYWIYGLGGYPRDIADFFAEYSDEELEEALFIRLKGGRFLLFGVLPEGGRLSPWKEFVEIQFMINRSAEMVF